MPDEYDDDGNLLEQESTVIRDLRTKAKRTDEVEAENGKLRNELAISRLGLDLTPAKEKALLAAHEGELTTEALNKTAVDLGFAEAPEPEPPQVSAEEQAAHQRAQAATNGAEGAEAHPETLEQRIARCKTPQELDELLANAGITVNAEE